MAHLVEAHEKARMALDLHPFDVIVKAGKNVIPEKGHLGHAPERGIVFVTVDPDSAALAANCNASLERMFVHELHHIARWDGPGYGRTLGEVLVTEGLAGHFVIEIFGGSPEPWEQLGELEIGRYLTVANQNWESATYDHAAWFFGSGDMPRWLGYSLGFSIVGRFLSEHPGRKPSDLSVVDAGVFHGCARQPLRVRAGRTTRTH
jgi:uncharacterized protein YjaZ